MTCIQHGNWGIDCGPECARLTQLWNDGYTRGRMDALRSVQPHVTGLAAAADLRAEIERGPA